MSSAPLLPLNDGASRLLFRPIRSGNAFEETVERLLQAIKLGVVSAGTQLPPERELATSLAVSRMTLREAIRSLQEAGYLETRRGRHGGTFVVDSPSGPSGDPRRIAKSMGAGVDDALDFRLVLEPGAAELAASRELPAEAAPYLQNLLKECRDAGPDSYRRIDSRLHLAIAELAGSPSLAASIADVRMRLNDLLDAIPLLERNIRHSNQQHEKIVKFILAGDPPAARAAMEEHLAGTAALLRGFLS